MSMSINCCEFFCGSFVHVSFYFVDSTAFIWKCQFFIHVYCIHVLLYKQVCVTCTSKRSSEQRKYMRWQWRHSIYISWAYRRHIGGILQRVVALYTYLGLILANCCAWNCTRHTPCEYLGIESFKFPHFNSLFIHIQLYASDMAACFMLSSKTSLQFIYIIQVYSELRVDSSFMLRELYTALD